MSKKYKTCVTKKVIQIYPRQKKKKNQRKINSKQKIPHTIIHVKQI